MRRKGWLGQCEKVSQPTSLGPEDFPTILASRLGVLAHELAADREAQHRQAFESLRAENAELRALTGNVKWPSGSNITSKPHPINLDFSPEFEHKEQKLRQGSQGDALRWTSSRQDTATDARACIGATAPSSMSQGMRDAAASAPDDETNGDGYPHYQANASADSMPDKRQHDSETGWISYPSIQTSAVMASSNSLLDPAHSKADRKSNDSKLSSQGVRFLKSERKSEAGENAEGRPPIVQLDSIRSEAVGYVSGLNSEMLGSEGTGFLTGRFQVLRVWKDGPSHSPDNKGVIKKMVGMGGLRSLNAGGGADKSNMRSLAPVRRALQTGVPTFAAVKSKMTLRGLFPLDWMVLDPCSARRTVWDLFGMLLVMFDCVRIPLEFLDPPESQFLTIMTWITRLYWTCDLWFSFFTGYIRGDGSTEYSFRLVAKRYACFWLVPDLLLVSIDWMDFVSTANVTGENQDDQDLARITKTSRLNRVFRALRMLRLVRVLRISESFRQLSESAVSEHFTVVWDIFMILLFIIGLAHVIACVWYGMGNWKTRWGENAWLHNQLEGLHEITLLHKYFVALHWSVSQFTGGMDEFTPVNVEERILTVAVMLEGIVIHSICISALTSAMTRLMIISSAPARQLAKLRSFLHKSQVSTELVTRIQCNAKHIINEQQRCMAERDVELLMLISEPLRAELHFEIRAPQLTMHGFFHRYCLACPDGMRNICHHAVSLKSTSPGDLLFTCGETPAIPQMLFVKDGSLMYDSPNAGRIPVAVGQWISEASLWTEWEHCGALTAEKDCVLCILNAATFQTIVGRFSTALVDPFVYAEEFVHALNHVGAEDMSDLEMKLMPEYNTGRIRDGQYIRNSARSMNGRSSAVTSGGRSSIRRSSEAQARQEMDLGLLPHNTVIP